MANDKLISEIALNQGAGNYGKFEKLAKSRTSLIQKITNLLSALPASTAAGGVEGVVGRTFKIGVVLSKAGTFEEDSNAIDPLTGKKVIYEFQNFLVRVVIWLPVGADEKKSIEATKFLASLACSCALDALDPDGDGYKRASEVKSMTTTDALNIENNVYTEGAFRFEIGGRRGEPPPSKKNPLERQKIKMLLENADDGLGSEKLLKAVLELLVRELGHFNQRFCGRKSLDARSDEVARNEVCIISDGLWADSGLVTSMTVEERKKRDIENKKSGTKSGPPLVPVGGKKTRPVRKNEKWLEELLASSKTNRDARMSKSEEWKASVANAGYTLQFVASEVNRVENEDDANADIFSDAETSSDDSDDVNPAEVFG